MPAQQLRNAELAILKRLEARDWAGACRTLRGEKRGKVLRAAVIPAALALGVAPITASSTEPTSTVYGAAHSVATALCPRARHSPTSSPDIAAAAAKRQRWRRR